MLVVVLVLMGVGAVAVAAAAGGGGGGRSRTAEPKKDSHRTPVTVRHADGTESFDGGAQLGQRTQHAIDLGKVSSGDVVAVRACIEAHGYLVAPASGFEGDADDMLGRFSPEQSDVMPAWAATFGQLARVSGSALADVAALDVEGLCQIVDSEPFPESLTYDRKHVDKHTVADKHRPAVKLRISAGRLQLVIETAPSLQARTLAEVKPWPLFINVRWALSVNEG